MAKQNRQYRSRVRAAAAARTRQAVVDAAAELFTEQGYAPTTMRAIAERAGTSVETVHGHGPKPALLRAAFESRFAPVPETDLGEGGRLEPARVERALRPIVRRFADSAGVYRALIAAADTDPQVRALVTELRTVQRSQISDRLRPLLGARARRQTADALALLVSHTAFEHFVTHCGWSPARYRNWAARAICAELS